MQSLAIKFSITAFFALFLASFQNCADPMQQPSALSQSGLDDSCDYENFEEDENCIDEQGRSSEQLLIQPFQDVIPVAQSPNGVTYVEVQGDCFDASYPLNRIEYRFFRLVDDNGQVVSRKFHSGTLPNGCQGTAFLGRIRLPNEYDFSRSQDLELELIAVDEQGRDITSPAAKYQITLVPAQ